ncbi:MAG: hypothetical protein JST30_02605 [Armatimonadetes bacterium]|nr:hypothetical protein [Armatimonadota bacterium]
MIWGTLSLLAVTQAQEVDEGKIVAASLFKNGYAVVVREAPFNSGKAVVTPPVSTSLGTLWISASESVKLERAWTGSIETKSERNAVTWDELLSANVGKRLTLETSPAYPGQNPLVTGTVLSADGPMVVLASEGEKRVALMKSSIVRIVAGGETLAYKVPASSTRTVIEIRGQGDGKVYVASLQRGMTWVPAYRIDISDDKRLDLTAKATVMNDLNDLEGVAVNLVTGFPNVRFIAVPDPFGSGASVDQFVNSLMYGATDRNFRRDAMTQNAARMGETGSAGGEFLPDPSATGTQLEDLFFYKQPGVTLKRGERGYYIVLKATAEYEPVYRVEIPDGYVSSGEWRADAEALDVWHTLKFKNTSGQPLTTAAVLTVKNGEVLGQDMLNYTSPNAETSVRVTKALDVSAETTEEETGRVVGVVKNGNRNVYDRVTVKGVIEVTNRKGKEVQMKVVKTATGEATAGPGVEVKKTPAGLRQANPVSVLTWSPRLKAGAKARAEYTLQVLVPSAN